MVEGGFDMPAPILAAFWQAMGRGLEAFEECRWGGCCCCCGAGLGGTAATEHCRLSIARTLHSSEGRQSSGAQLVHVWEPNTFKSLRCCPFFLPPPRRYLCDTPFPFSWAQLLVVMLLCFQFTLPFAIVSAGGRGGAGLRRQRGTRAPAAAEPAD